MRLAPAWALYAGFGVLSFVGGALLRAGLEPAAPAAPVGAPEVPEADLRALLTCVLPDPPGPELIGSRQPEPSPAAPAGERPPVTVRVVDARTRAGLAGVRVEVVGLVPPDGVEPESVFVRVSDRSGSVRFTHLPSQGPATVRARSPGSAPRGNDPNPEASMWAAKALHAELMALLAADASEDAAISPPIPPRPWFASGVGRVVASAALARSETTLVVPTTLPLEAEIVSDADGRPVPQAGWRAAERTAWSDETWGPTPVVVDADSAVELGIDVVAPPGYLAFEERCWHLHVDPRARRLTAVYPLRREASVDVVLPESGPGAGRIEGHVEIRVANTRVALRLEDSAFGRLRFEGCPHLPGDLLALWGIGDGWLLEASLELPGTSSTPLVIRPDVRAAPPVPPELRDVAAFAAAVPDGQVRLGPGGAWEYRHEHLLRHRFHSELAEEEAGEVPADGFPDQDGATVHVVVTDATDRPVPFATLDVRLAEGAWTDVDAEGTQRIDPFTDVNGRRTLRDLAPGRATIQASCGTRSTRAHALLRAGEERTMRLRLPGVLPEPAPSPEPEVGER